MNIFYSNVLSPSCLQIKRSELSDKATHVILTLHLIKPHRDTIIMALNEENEFYHDHKIRRNFHFNVFISNHFASVLRFLFFPISELIDRN